MNFVLILLLQTLGSVIGGVVLLDRSITVGKIQRRKENRNDKGNSAEEGNESERSKNKKENKRRKEKWVVDSIFYEDYQSDSPVNTMVSLDVCPPVPDVITDEACAQSSCQRDTDCSDGYRCCFTGCSFTCLPEIKPAALVDWKKEPRRSRSGIAWLIKDPKGASSSEVTFEECSTSPVESDEDPLLCPNGYFCHVTDPGNPKKGKPNSGYCVRQIGETYSPVEEELVISSALKGRKSCKADNIVLLDGAKVTLKDKHCRCKQGYLSCKKRSFKATKAKKKSKRRKTDNKSKKENGRNNSS